MAWIVNTTNGTRAFAQRDPSSEPQLSYANQYENDSYSTTCVRHLGWLGDGPEVTDDPTIRPTVSLVWCNDLLRNLGFVVPCNQLSLVGVSHVAQ